MRSKQRPKRLGAMGALVLALVGCGAPGDRFDRMMEASRTGRDAETQVLARELLADPSQPKVVKARTEMTLALVHIRAKDWPRAKEALGRARALGIESDTGYFRDHLAEYQGWIPEDR